MRPKSTKIPINYDDQICLHQQSINKSCTALCSQLSWKNILPEGCENSLINYKCSTTYHILYFEMLKHTYIYTHVIRVCRYLSNCFSVLYATQHQMLSRIKWKFVKNLYSLLKIQILLKMLMFPMPLMLRSGSVSLIFHFCASRTALRLCSSPHATPSLPSIYFLHLFKRTS